MDVSYPSVLLIPKRNRIANVINISIANELLL